MIEDRKRGVEVAAQPAAGPGDEALPGTRQTGEGLFPICSGSGRTGTGSCAACNGTGRVVVNIGDA
jgi:DnaJ-class molecular chaperone